MNEQSRNQDNLPRCGRCNGRTGPAPAHSYLGQAVCPSCAIELKAGPRGLDASPAVTAGRPSPGLEPGDIFVMGSIQCRITHETSFRDVPHFGFVFHKDNGQLLAGLMPVEFVKRFTGHACRPIRGHFQGISMAPFPS